MSFKDDFIAAALDNHQRAARSADTLTDEQKYSVAFFSHLALSMQQAVVIRLRGDQAQIFLNTPSIGEQNYTEWLRLPFPSVYVQLDAPVKFIGYLGELDDATLTAEDERRRVGASPLNIDVGGAASIDRHELLAEPDVRGIYIAQSESSDFLAKMSGVILQHAQLHAGEDAGEDVPTWQAPSNPARVIQAHFLMPTRSYLLNVHTVALFVTKDNRLDYSRAGFWQTRQRMIDWAVHFVNFLSSPSVKLVEQQHDPALQRRRQKDGKSPKPGWYEITYRKHIHEYTPNKISPKAWHQSYRYDVRGHFKRFERGRMAGRVIWCPPHQRGLAHDLYRPRGYRIVEEKA